MTVTMPGVLYCIVLYCIVLYCIVLRFLYDRHYAWCIVLYCIVLYCIVLYCFCCLFVCYLYPINNVICSLPWVAVVYCYWIHYLCWFLTPRHTQVFRISNKIYLEYTITFWFLYVFLDQYSSTSLVNLIGQKFNVMK